MTNYYYDLTDDIKNYIQDIIKKEEEDEEEKYEIMSCKCLWIYKMALVNEIFKSTINDGDNFNDEEFSLTEFFIHTGRDELIIYETYLLDLGFVINEVIKKYAPHNRTEETFEELNKIYGMDFPI